MLHYLWLATVGTKVGSFLSQTSSGFAASQCPKGILKTCSGLGLTVGGVQVVLAHGVHLPPQLELLQQQMGTVNNACQAGSCQANLQVTEVNN